MGHNCQHHHTSENIRTAFFLNLGFAIIELIGGILTNSVAILSDALHDLGDSIALGAAWYAQRVSKKGADSNFSYGYGRISLLAAFLNAVILLCGSVFIILNAIPRLFNPEVTHAPGMILLAILGVGMNAFAAWRMRNEGGMNARMVSLHLLEDALGWAAVLVVGIILIFQPLYILDPILSLAITAYILYGVILNLRKTIKLFLQAVPDELELSNIESDMRSVEGVKDTYDTHIWSLDGDHHVVSSHVVVDKHLSREEVVKVKDTISKILRDFHVKHLTLEIEYEDSMAPQVR